MWASSDVVEFPCSNSFDLCWRSATKAYPLFPFFAHLLATPLSGILCSRANKKHHKASGLTKRRRLWVLKWEQVCLWDGGDISKADGLKGKCSENKETSTRRERRETRGQVCIFWFSVQTAHLLDFTSHSHTRRRWCKHRSMGHFCRQSTSRLNFKQLSVMQMCRKPTCASNETSLPSPSPTATYAWPPAYLPGEETITQRDKTAPGRRCTVQPRLPATCCCSILLFFSHMAAKHMKACTTVRFHGSLKKLNHHRTIQLVANVVAMSSGDLGQRVTPGTKGKTEIKTWNSISSNQIFSREKLIEKNWRQTQGKGKTTSLQLWFPQASLRTAVTDILSVWSVGREKKAQI